MRVSIIGAGPSGMTAALQLARQGIATDVFEAGPRVGGMSSSIELWGQRVDLGPHRFFSTDPRVNRLWYDVVGDEYTLVDRQTRILYRGRFFNYPLTPANAAWNIGFREAMACLISHWSALGRREELDPREVSFESWVVNRFGHRLYELFFRSYSEKLWGIPCHELSADFAAQRIRDLSLGQAMLSVLSRRHQGRHRSLADQFPYPLAGTGSVYEAMAQEVIDRGGRIHLGQPVRRVIRQGRRSIGVELASGESRSFDHVISTMPLTHLVEGLDDAPRSVRHAVGELRFRNTILIYLHVDSDSLFPDQWLYLHDPGLTAGRVTNFRNWSPSLYGDATTTILAVERWCQSTDSVWSRDSDRLIRHAAEELRSTGLIGHQAILDGHVIRLPRCYPIYRLGYRRHVEVISDYLRRIEGLSVIGRYGAFKYNNQDHGILMGILAAENLTHGSNHDLWEVNANDFSYQERDVDVTV